MQHFDVEGLLSLKSGTWPPSRCFWWQRLLHVKSLFKEYCCWGLRVKSPTALILWRMFSYCSSPTETVVVCRRGVISRMFPAAESAFIITAPDILLGLNPSLILVAAAADDCRRLSSEIQCQRVASACISPVSQTKWNTVFKAVGRAGKVKRKPPHFLTSWVFWHAPTAHNHNTTN